MRRAAAFVAVVIAATVLPTATARATTCAPLPPATASSDADWVIVVSVAPYGAKQFWTTSQAEFDHTSHSVASGWLTTFPSGGSIAWVDSLSSSERHDVVRVGDHVIQRHGHQPMGNGGQVRFSNGGTWGEVAPCTVVAELMFVPGSHLASVRSSAVGAAGGYSVTYTGRGGGALLASDSKGRPSVAAGEYAGKFKLNWTATKGLVGGLDRSCGMCKGKWTAPNGRSAPIAFGNDRSDAIAGPPGRWQLTMVAASGGATGPGLIGAWADVGNLRSLLNASEVR
jgi:hypothetical protein